MVHVQAGIAEFKAVGVQFQSHCAGHTVAVGADSEERQERKKASDRDRGTNADGIFGRDIVRYLI